MAKFCSKLSSLLDQPVVLELDLARGVLDARPANPLQAIQLLNATTMPALRTALHQAAKAEHVKGLIVHAGNVGLAVSMLDEVALEVERFAEHKPTVVWSESFGEGDPGLALYKMATAAHEVWLQPTGMLTLSGAGAQITLLKGGLNKLGVEPEFGKRHEYKTAADQFAADEVSDANREMVTAIVEGIVDDAVSTIAQRRGLEVDVVRAAMKEAPISAQRALEIGLVDRLGYRDEVYKSALGEWEAKPEQLRFVSRYALKPDLRKALRRNRKKIGVVSIRGAIVTGRGSTGVMGQQVGADVVDEHLRQALRDDSIVSVLLDVDSPGGSAVASDFIRRSVHTLREAGKPVVARMGAVAASGGYYVSMPADEIVALPSTLTGSIGVFAGKMVTQGLYDKLGLVRESITADPWAAAMSPTRKLDEDGWRRLNEWLDRVYLDFTTAAAEDRNMSYEELERLARGRVWTGSQACERGLVDHVGGYRLALEQAALLAGMDIDDVDVVPVGLAGTLARLKPAHSSESAGHAGLAPVSIEGLWSAALRELGLPSYGVLTMPFELRLR